MSARQLRPAAAACGGAGRARPQLGLRGGAARGRAGRLPRAVVRPRAQQEEEGQAAAKPGGWFPFRRAREVEAEGPPKEYLYTPRLGMPVVRDRLSYNDLLRDIRWVPPRLTFSLSTPTLPGWRL